MYFPKHKAWHPCSHPVDERIRFRAGDSPEAVTNGAGICTGASPLTYTEPRVQVELATLPAKAWNLCSSQIAGKRVSFDCLDSGPGVTSPF